MAAPVPTSCFKQWRSTLEATCRADCADANGSLQFVEENLSGTSRLTHVTWQTETGAVRYVLKTLREGAPAADWRPKREYDGLKAMVDSMQSTTWQVVPPVAFGDEPPFVLTRFVQGKAGRLTGERGLRRFARQSERRMSASIFESAGHCLADLQQNSLVTESSEKMTREAFESFCQDRLDEISQFYKHSLVSEISSKGSSWLSSVLNEVWTPAEANFATPSPCHGDFSLQNFLILDDGKMCLLDLEGYKATEINQDFAVFRTRLEHLALNPRFSPLRLVEAWAVFQKAACPTESLTAHAVLSYIYRMLAQLAWIANPRNTRRLQVSTRVRDRLWARRRIRWLARAISDEHVIELDQNLVRRI